MPSGYFGSWIGGIEFFNEFLEGDQELGVIVGGMGLHELDDLSVAVCGFLRFTAGFIDHAETVITVVHFGIVGDQFVSSLLSLIEFVSLDQINDGVGGGVEFIAPFGEVIILGLLFGESRCESGLRISLVLLILL